MDILSGMIALFLGWIMLTGLSSLAIFIIYYFIMHLLKKEAKTDKGTINKIMIAAGIIAVLFIVSSLAQGYKLI